MITQKQIEEIRKELAGCKNPLFLYHDDCDGLTSFLQLYKYVGDGNGVMVKRATPNIDLTFLEDVKKHEPDKMFILDVAMVEQDFLDSVKLPVIWIDHHQILRRERVKYYNPRIENPNDKQPIAYWSYRIAEKSLWIGVLGSVADWFMPEFADEFVKEYPDLLPKIMPPQEALFNTELGKLIKIVAFNIKGTKSEVEKFVKVMMKVKSPYEILHKSTPEGEAIYKKYERVNKEYQELLARALEHSEEKLLVFKYRERDYALSEMLANELIYSFPEKIIIVAREKGDEFKCSMRSSKINLLPILAKASEGLNARGGGHEQACGAAIAAGDFDEFVKRFREMI